MIRATLIILLALMVGSGVSPGIRFSAPPGQFIYNVDPTLTSPDVNQVYDANFIPGFQAGLTNTTVEWSSGPGYGQVDYQVGPWSHEEVGLPHLAVGPQCCNFEEVPRTQQFRRPNWGDYYFVKAGFVSPGVNVANYTSDFRAPAFVGLRTDWEWTVSLSLNWSNPELFDGRNEWAAIGIAVTQYVPVAPGRLVYTVLNFWTDSNSSNAIKPGAAYAVTAPNVVVYHPLQVSTAGNLTVSLNVSPYLRNTTRILGFDNGAAPVISYVYLNIEGYNFAWKTRLYSFMVMSDHSPDEVASTLPFAYQYLSLMVAALVVATVQYEWRNPRPRDS